MDLFALFLGYGAWSWLVAGLILLGLELLLPGGVFVWLGVVPYLTRPVLNHGVADPMPLQFTETEVMRREWLEHGRFEPVAPPAKAGDNKP